MYASSSYRWYFGVLVHDSLVRLRHVLRDSTHPALVITWRDQEPFSPFGYRLNFYLRDDFSDAAIDALLDVAKKLLPPNARVELATSFTPVSVNALTRAQLTSVPIHADAFTMTIHLLDPLQSASKEEKVDDDDHNHPMYRAYFSVTTRQIQRVREKVCAYMASANMPLLFLRKDTIVITMNALATPNHYNLCFYLRNHADQGAVDQLRALAQNVLADQLAVDAVTIHGSSQTCLLGHLNVVELPGTLMTDSDALRKEYRLYPNNRFDEHVLDIQVEMFQTWGPPSTDHHVESPQSTEKEKVLIPYPQRRPIEKVEEDVELKKTICADLLEMGIKPRPAFDYRQETMRCIQCGINDAEIVARPCEHLTLCAHCFCDYGTSPYADMCPDTQCLKRPVTFHSLYDDDDDSAM